MQSTYNHDTSNQYMMTANCIACRRYPVVHDASGTCTGCNGFLCYIINPAMRAARAHFARYKPAILYSNMSDNIKIIVHDSMQTSHSASHDSMQSYATKSHSVMWDEYCDAATIVLKIRDYICAQIGVKLGTSRRVINYIVRVSHGTGYNCDKEYSTEKTDDGTKILAYSTNIRVLVTKCGFTLADLAAETCAWMLIEGLPIDICALDDVSRGQVLKSQVKLQRTVPEATLDTMIDALYTK
ncbi:hypothetical protein F-VV57_0248 [Faustovirus]|nr:hypothetical protein F-VV57_0248 [Faustovirus]QJX73516.1 hypothetical protein F-VV63_0250 [Faustovirus]